MRNLTHLALKILRVGTVRGGVTIANFLLFALIARTLGLGAAGHFALYIALVTILGSVFGVGLPQVLFRRMGNRKSPSPISLSRYRTPYWISLFLLSPIFLAVSLFSVHVLGVFGGISIRLYYALGPLLYAFICLIVEEFRARNAPESAMIVESIGTTIAPLSAIAFMAAIDTAPDPLNVVIFSHIVGSGLSIAFFLFRNRLKFSGSKVRLTIANISPTDLASFTGFRLVSTCSGQLPVLFLGITSPPQIVGAIAVCLRIANLTSTYSAIINATYARAFALARRDTARLRTLVLQSSSLTFLGVCAISTPMILTPGLLVELFNTGRATPTIADALCLIASATILRSVVGVPDLVFITLGRPHLETIALLASLAAFVVVATYAPPTVAGAAWAVAVSHIVKTTWSAASLAVALRTPKSPQYD